MPSGHISSIERQGRSAVIRLDGDLTVPTIRQFYSQLQNLARRRDVGAIVLDFSKVGRVDSSGVAAVSLAKRQIQRQGKTLDVKQLGEHHRAAFAMVPRRVEEPDPVELPTLFERAGDRVLAIWDGAKALARLIGRIARQGALVAIRRKRLPAGSVGSQLISMGYSAVFIVSVMSALLGMTMAFQGIVQLKRFGAGVFVADMISLSMVRELGPLITAIILTGRTGAAIAAELGTMRVRSEIDALATMGIDADRFLILPRFLALTIAGPALTLMAMFVGILGGMLVATWSLDMPVAAYWQRVMEFVTFGDFAHGLAKSLLFSWIIAIAGSHFGMRASGDSNSVGHATTRTVVVSVLFIILVDAIFATVTTLARGAA